MNSRNAWRLRVVGFPVWSLVGATTFAQGVTEEIIVTAQKRAENLQEVPLSVTALTAETLQAGGIKHATDLGMVVPGLRWNVSAGIMSPFMRGIGSTNSGPGVESGFATYIDGVYIQSALQTAFALNNVAQVEVLKGPQGTLFGRNATGGLVNYKTKDPSQQLSGKLGVGYGNFDALETNLYVTGGLSTALAADLAVYYLDQAEGWGKNVHTGNDVSDREDIALRSKWLWQPADGTRITFAVDYTRSDSSQGNSFRPAYGIKPTQGPVYTGPAWSIDADIDPYLTAQQSGLSVKIEQEIGDMQFMSVSAYRQSVYRARYDGDTTTAYFQNGQNRMPERQLSQEIQLLSPDSGAFKWVTGVFMFNSSSMYDPFRVFGPVIPAPNVSRDIYVKQDTLSGALFAQGTLELGAATSLTVGSRYTLDRKEFSAKQVLVDAGGNQTTTVSTPESDNSVTYKTPTWRVALDHQFSDDLMAYVSYDRGFKSGAFQTSQFPRPPVKPEKIDAFEIGVKSELLEHAMRLNAAAFYYDYRDMQLNRLVDLVSQVTNAGRSEIYGVDVDVVVALLPSLQLSLGAELLHHEFKEYQNAPCSVVNPDPPGGNLNFFCDASGRKTVRAPDVTGTAMLDYELPTAIGDFDFNATYYYNDGFYPHANNFYRVGSYNTVNLLAGWRATDQRYRISIWGRNLTNAAYPTDMQVQSLGTLVTMAAPRTYGISAEISF